MTTFVVASILAALTRGSAANSSRAISSPASESTRDSGMSRAPQIALAGVAPQLLDAVGPVAAPTARAMAVGARQRCAATWGIGLTGVAGPEPHGGHAVGTVFLGLAGPVDADVVELALTGSRWEIRMAAVNEAIARLRALVEAQ